jgi:hypothetical protein
MYGGVLLYVWDYSMIRFFLNFVSLCLSRTWSISSPYDHAAFSYKLQSHHCHQEPLVQTIASQ